MDEMDFAKMEIDLHGQVHGEQLIVRNNCAFCQRERSAKDDNHGPECVYWMFFGPRQVD